MQVEERCGSGFYYTYRPVSKHIRHRANRLLNRLKRGCSSSLNDLKSDGAPRSTSEHFQCAGHYRTERNKNFKKPVAFKRRLISSEPDGIALRENLSETPSGIELVLNAQTWLKSHNSLCVGRVRFLRARRLTQTHHPRARPSIGA